MPMLGFNVANDGIRAVLGLLIAAVILGLGAWPAHAQTDGDPLSTKDDDNFRRGRTVDVGHLDSPNQGQTVPFQVPFYLAGKITADDNGAEEGGEIVDLRIHLFDAPRPFRVELVEDKLRCSVLETGQRVGAPRAEWDLTALDEYQSADQPCGLLRDAGHWNVPRPPEVGEDGNIRFAAALPPVSASRYFVFGIQERRKLSAEDAKAFVNFVKGRVSLESLFTSESVQDFTTNVCEQVAGFAKKQNIVIQPRAGRCEAAAEQYLYDLIQSDFQIQINRNDLGRYVERLTVPDGFRSPVAADTFERLAFSDRLSVLREEVEMAEKLFESAKTEADKEIAELAVLATRSSLQLHQNQVDTLSAQAELLVGNNLTEAIQNQFVAIDSSTVYGFQARQKMYLSADIGFVGGVGDVEEVVPYLGTNIYFRPVNKEAPLPPFWQSPQPLSRCGLTLGVTLDGIAKDGERADLFSDYSVVGGLGCRITESIRLGGGAIVYQELDPNPLIDDEKLAAAPYVSISVDWDVREFFVGINRLFTRALGGGES